jgi:hypothetical protein
MTELLLHSYYGRWNVSINSGLCTMVMTGPHIQLPLTHMKNILLVTGQSGT